MLDYAQEIGWEYVRPGEALGLRGGEGGLYFGPVLEAQLLRLNPGVVDAERASDVMRRLGLLTPTIEGNRDALAWLRGEGSVFVAEEGRERNVRLVDFARPDNNIFQVTDEWVQRGAVFRNRADVVFSINGIPVGVAETKAAGKRDGLAEGVEQLRRYHRETPELFVATQVFGVTQLLDLYYGVTWSTSRKSIFSWKDELGDDAPGGYEHKVKRFFDRGRFLRTLRDYIVFLTRDDELNKIVLRQHQTRAVERVLERIYEPGKRRALVWHTQGSGKTLTMITIAARLLREARGAEKPTVLLIVDRNELEAQLFKNVAGYGIGEVEVAASKQDLRRILASDYRGLIVSMIHKFDDIPADMNARESIVVLVDEAHRTTGGDLGTYLLAALPRATFVGFTGTPIDRLFKGQGTFKVFGPDDERGYLDKYSIAESIEDGTTVPLNYALAPSDLRVDRETLERQFLGLTDAEGVSDLEELNAILDRAVELKELMKAPDRVDRIAATVARHFRENVAPLGFKAFLVAVDREACALYKAALDRYLSPEWSQVVYSPAHNDGPALKAYYLSPDEEKEVRKAFIKKDRQPKILIVTEKLLTGFDAPILYCLYLDKPMRDHVLLQAIARVNRPYEDEDGQVKPYGFVLDFVGIFEKLERALAFDSEVVASVIQNIDVLKDLFARMLRETAPPYLRLARGWDDRAKDRAIEHFADRAARDEFFAFFQRLQNLYDILSPDAFLRPFIEDYHALAELFGLIRNAYGDRVYVDRELTAKTRELLRRRTTSERLELPGAIHQLGPRELAALKQATSSDNTKVLNLRKILTATVEKEGTAKPFLLSIGERAAELAEAYEDRQVTTQQVLVEFERLAQEYVEADAQRQQLGLDENAFAIHRELRRAAGGGTPEQAREVDALFARFPDFVWNEQQKSKLRAELYKALRPLVGPGKMIEVANALLRVQRL
jgi:type I restriction enzyme R subunit